MSIYNTCEWERIEGMLKKVLHHLPDIHHRSLDLALVACEQLFTYPKELEKRPTFSKIQTEMKALHEAGEAFIAAINALSPATKTAINDRADMETEALAEQYQINDPRPLLVNLPTFSEVRADVQLIIGLATNPKEWLYVPRKAPEAPRRAFIRTMATVYEKTTGQPATRGINRDPDRSEIRGLFFSLIYDCLLVAKRKPQSERALEMHMYRTLRGRKPRIEPWGVTQQEASQ